MNLVDENVGGAKSNKKLFIACGVGIVTLILVIVILVGILATMNKGIVLTIDNKNQTKKGYLWKDGDVYYIQIAGLAESTNNGYTYKTGNPDIPWMLYNKRSRKYIF